MGNHWPTSRIKIRYSSDLEMKKLSSSRLWICFAERKSWEILDCVRRYSSARMRDSLLQEESMQVNRICRMTKRDFLDINTWCSIPKVQEFHLLIDIWAMTWLLCFRKPEGRTACWIENLHDCSFASKFIRSGNTPIRMRSFENPSWRHLLTSTKSYEYQAAWMIRAITATSANGCDGATLQRKELDLNEALQIIR
jgi:hypothetical protein